MIESCACDFYIAPGFSSVAIAGNVTTTSLVVGNAMGTPNATTLGKCIKTITDASRYWCIIITAGGIPTNTVGVPIMKVCKHCCYYGMCRTGSLLNLLPVKFCLCLGHCKHGT